MERLGTMLHSNSTLAAAAPEDGCRVSNCCPHRGTIDDYQNFAKSFGIRDIRGEGRALVDRADAAPVNPGLNIQNSRLVRLISKTQQAPAQLDNSKPFCSPSNRAAPLLGRATDRAKATGGHHRTLIDRRNLFVAVAHERTSTPYHQRRVTRTSRENGACRLRRQSPPPRRNGGPSTLNARVR